MKTFRAYLQEQTMPAVSVTSVLTENLDKSDVRKMLELGGFRVKDTTVKKRLAVVSDTRGETMTNILNLFKAKGQGAEIDKSPAVTKNISSIGLITIDDSSIQVVVKPASQDVLKAETEATNALNKIIKSAVEQTGGPITVTIGSYSIKDVTVAGSDHIRGDPKADIALMTSKGREVGFISHKKEGGARAFQQYGGISKKAGRVIFENSMVQKYVKDLEKAVGGTAKSGQSFYRYIPNTQDGKLLVGRSVYGPDYRMGGGNFGRNSVHCIGQGTPQLTKTSDGVYKLTFSEAMHTANQISWAFKRDNYRAIFASTFRNGRKTEVKGATVSNMRSGIYPYDFVAGRRATELK
tara:strand:- start:168 stop:1220 length:1053 start_codon:yes stop_codon:yes gene_type:complete